MQFRSRPRIYIYIYVRAEEKLFPSRRRTREIPKEERAEDPFLSDRDDFFHENKASLQSILLTFPPSRKFILAKRGEGEELSRFVSTVFSIVK